MSICLLEDQLINKIAAGEVIERPGSIVKELVENAIDAGSSKINVQIAGGGISAISVEDDGQGIPAEELELALARHATSKIRHEEDLYQVMTMGFRGEALPSIASISRLTIHTQAPDSIAVCGQWEGGRLLSITPQPSPPGTRIQVKDIFFNTPVRRSFLKSVVTEQNHIYDVMVRMALSRPDVSFSLTSEKKRYFKTSGNGDMGDCMLSIYGSEYKENFLPLEWSGEKVSVCGMISRPEFRRSNRKQQFFYVNQRSVRSPLLARALDVAYQGFQLAKEYPSVVLFLKLDPQTVDINIHPQKLEVKFHDDQEIFRMLKQLVQTRLEQHSYHLPVFAPSFAREHAAPSGSVSHPTGRPYNPVVDESRQFYHPAFRFREEAEKLSPGVAESAFPGPAANLKPSMEDLVIIGQLFQGYLVVESQAALWIVDQHAAQERILFNRLEEHFQRWNWEQQILALPLSLDMEAKYLELIESRMEDFKRLGIELELIGPHQIVLRALPTYFKGQERDLLEELLQLMESGTEEYFYREALAAMACKASIRAGDILSRTEMYHLMSDLLACRDYKNCPHGRPLIFQLSRHELERYFKRI